MNIELLKRLSTRFLRMRHIEHFNMRPVAAKTDCGAVMCIAGHTLDLAGYKMRLDPEAPKHDGDLTGRMDYDFISPKTGVAINPTEVLQVAADELGLDYDTEAHPLFHNFKLKTPKRAAARIQELIDSAG